MDVGEAKVVLVEVLEDGSGRRREWTGNLETARAIALMLGEPSVFAVFARGEPLDLNDYLKK